MNTNTENMTEIDTIDLVKSNSIRASKEGFSILDALKSGDLSLTEASEYSNAIGKINAANGNILKADLITLAIDKADGDRVKRLVQNEEAIA